MAHRRIILSLATAAVLVLGAAPAAVAGPTSTDREAAGILATATPGEPLTVVTTTETASGPQFTTEVAGSHAEAKALISDALADPGTAAVDLAHQVSIATDTAVTKKRKSSKTRRSNDSQRKRQWALDRLAAEKVWRKSSGKGVVVAVVDTGVQANHPDLKGQVLKGWDFVESDSKANDRNGHGTHVAGIIAAKANNKRGIAGLAPSSRILPVRVLNSAGTGSTVAVARGIVYAARKGADVINLSLAGNSPDAQVQAAVRYAVRRGVVVVAAAGNSGCNAPTTYPAAFPGVIGVGASDRSDGVAPFSNCGTYVDVVAPGTGITSTMIKRPSLSLPCAYGKSYCVLDGTSMASPHVAAAAAILISRTKHRLTLSKVAYLLTARADDIVTPGYDTTSGRGVLNIRRALVGR
ncbi:S8 family serine peptidase [Aeromicrobium fastidiosum]|uniref:S8 family serine peptidase n=1 Tax=Aeromicrobium fastidiosum TaxID=52699 RepID=UPI00165EE13A|nr:S8 family serine peptidase [Aeromicrobium fastidiosum]MBP2389179.1 type VII secretion-associated serine protease mycosin [Aeromicrobium fastidiosum]